MIQKRLSEERVDMDAKTQKGYQNNLQKRKDLDA